jgi:transcriptional regulator with XRE-family HTH domain
MRAAAGRGTLGTLRDGTARCRLRRRGLGLSMDALAKLARVHPNTVWSFELGLVPPSLSTLFRIYSALHVERVTGSQSGIVLH